MAGSGGELKKVRSIYISLSFLLLIMGMCGYLFFRDFSNIALFTWMPGLPVPVAPRFPLPIERIVVNLGRSPLRFNTAPLGAVNTGGAGDLFPRKGKDFKVKSSIPQGLPCGGSLTTVPTITCTIVIGSIWIFYQFENSDRPRGIFGKNYPKTEKW